MGILLIAGGLVLLAGLAWLADAICRMEGFVRGGYTEAGRHPAQFHQHR